MINFNTPGITMRPAKTAKKIKFGMKAPKAAIWNINSPAAKRSARKIRISK